MLSSIIPSRNQVKTHVNNPNYQEIKSKINFFQVLKKMIDGRIFSYKKPTKHVILYCYTTIGKVNNKTVVIRRVTDNRNIIRNN